MANANIKIIHIELNPFGIQNKDSNFEIRGGDNIRFIFACPIAQTPNLETTDSGTAQVQAINAQNGFEAFAKEGTYTVDSTDAKTLNAIVEFKSSETAYGQNNEGDYNLIVALKDASGNVVISGVIPFKLYNVGYTGIIEPPESIRDTILDDINEAGSNALSEIQTEKTSALYSISQAKSDSLGAISNAKDDALKDIEVYTDPDGRISNLEKTTSKVGRFYVNGGKAQRTFNTLGSVPFGFCFSYAKKTAWKNGDMPFNSGNISPSVKENGISMYIAGGLVNFYFEIRTKSALQTGSKLAIPYSKFPTDGKLHTVQFIVPSADVATWKAFVDGVDIAPESNRITGNFDGSFALDSILAFGGTGILGNPLEVEFARIFIANYDMSASDAPYSVADYTAGKLPPPSVCNTSAGKRALLALDDYSIEVGSTKYIPDISGGANDFTVIGDFKGDKDISIKRLAALISQSNA